MAQVFTTKEQNFINRFVPFVVSLMALADQGTPLTTEFSDETYGTGGANALTDATVQTVLPAVTAAQFASAEGAIVTILAAIATNRGFLEVIRP